MKIAINLTNGYIQPHSQKDIDTLKEFGNGIYEVDIKNMDTRTLAQNRSYHLWASMIASTLNSTGMTVPKIIKLDTVWSSERIKELIFKPTIKALYNKKSSTQLKKNEFDGLIDTIIQAFASKGISIPEFPSYED